MRSMKDYPNLYLECDVLLSADAFEKFRNNSLKNYGLCPSHYLSTSSTLFKLELVPDPDKHIFVEKGRRDGISYISNR